MAISNDRQILKLKRRLGIADSSEDDLLMEFLDDAKAQIMARRYPFGNFPTDLDERYADLQVRIALEMYNKQGAEGENSHSENGVSRSYEDYGYLLSEVTPLVGGIRR